LFHRYKFLRDGWHEYQPDASDSSSSLVQQKVIIPERGDYKDIWERVIVRTIRLKYIKIKCNRKNKIRAVYKSEYEKNGATILHANDIEHLLGGCQHWFKWLRPDLDRSKFSLNLV
jgi:hypothetical protein